MLENFYRQFVNAGDLVFDIGANIGSHSRAFLSLGARVVAVEPDPRCHLELYEIPNLKVAPVAAGVDGVLGKLRFGNSTCASTLSGQWIESITKINRFGGFEWPSEVSVIQYSLDHLIQVYGLPAFIKIDVEGYEKEVMHGLTQPVKALSLEFVPEFSDSAEACIRRAGALGMREFAYSLEDSFVLSDWITGVEMLDRLPRFDPRTYGDIYARL
jgi:FkbM family methyltransferase